MLRSDLDAPKKQRHTARRVLARLVDEHGAQALSYSTVRDHVRKRRPQILAEAGRPLELGYVPQTHEPGAEAEVDFHDLWVILAGVKTKTTLFTMRLSYSARAAHRAFDDRRPAFLEGHEYAFSRFGGYAGVDTAGGAETASEWAQPATGSADVVDAVPGAFGRSGR